MLKPSYDSGCEIICKFGKHNSIYDRLFGLSVITVDNSRTFGEGLSQRVCQWTSSFEQVALFDRCLEGTEIGSRPKLQNIHATVREGFGNYNIAMFSAFDKSKHLLVYSMICRVIELFAINFQPQINRTQWHPVLKYLAIIATMYASSLIARFLGWAVFELVVSAIATYSLTKILPHSWANKIREVDMVSSTSDFNAKEFMQRNLLYFLRNLFVSYVVCDIIIRYMAFFGRERAHPFRRDEAQIQYCAMGTQYKAAFYSVESDKGIEGFFLVYLMQELGWTTGKIIIDLLCVLAKKAGFIQDLRNIKEFYPKSLLNKMGVVYSDDHCDVYTKPKKKKNKKNSKLTTPKPKTQHKKSTKASGQNTDKLILSEPSTKTSTVLVQSPEEETPILNKPTPELEPSQKRPSKYAGKKTGRTALEKLGITPKVDQTVDDIVAKVYFKKAHLTAIPLEGANIPHVNVWGMIIDDSKNDSSYSNALESGNIGLNAKIKPVQYATGVYELKPTGRQDKRLLGAILIGSNAIYNELKQYMSLEQASDVANKLMEFNDLARKEKTAIIFFKKEAAKHHQINDVAKLLKN